jgi:predicted acyl esterase
MRKLLALIPVLALAVPAAAQAADPFGHPCTAQNGVRFCPTANDAQRVPSWDGVPLDVDVTLPPTGDGPFPTIVMMHGWGGSKTNFETTSPAGRYNNVFFAQRGYAVVTYSARGFGRSCGVPASRTSPGCDRGWVHLSDQRYESRDTQHLLGQLVDQDIAKASALGVTGISYGGIQSHNLARLRDRIRLPNGKYQRWRSPAGKPLAIKAAWPRWGTTDLTYALTPNGHLLDYRSFPQSASRRPLGVMKRSYVNGLYTLGTISGFIAPQGADPSADLTRWRAITDQGEPYGGAAAGVARELSTYHSAGGVSGVPAPLLVQNGWTDDLFPATEALRVYLNFRKSKKANIAFQLGDLGHPRGSNKANADAYFNRQGAAFFDAYLKGKGKPPRRNSVTAFTQTCPKEAPAGGPYRAKSWPSLSQVSFAVPATPPRAQVVTSDGGNPATGKALDQVLTGDACVTVPEEHAPGTAVAQWKVTKPFTMLGMPEVDATIRTSGSGGYLAARLWDVSGGRQMLVSRGVYRLADDQRGSLAFQLFGNGWRFKRGHVAKLELVGRDPEYLRPSNESFTVKVSKLTFVLPTDLRIYSRSKPTRQIAQIR